MKVWPLIIVIAAAVGANTQSIRFPPRNYPASRNSSPNKIAYPPIKRPYQPKSPYFRPVPLSREYNFGYVIKNRPTLTDFEQQEKSEGSVTSGSYRVNLPDGRVQIVDYRVTPETGNVVNVRYEGEAKYAEFFPANPANKQKPENVSPVKYSAPDQPPAPVKYSAPVRTSYTPVKEPTRENNYSVKYSAPVRKPSTASVKIPTVPVEVPAPSVYYPQTETKATIVEYTSPADPSPVEEYQPVIKDPSETEEYSAPTPAPADYSVPDPVQEYSAEPSDSTPEKYSDRDDPPSPVEEYPAILKPSDSYDPSPPEKYSDRDYQGPEDNSAPTDTPAPAEEYQAILKPSDSYDPSTQYSDRYDPPGPAEYQDIVDPYDPPTSEEYSASTDSPGPAEYPVEEYPAILEVLDSTDPPSAQYSDRYDPPAEYPSPVEEYSSTLKPSDRYDPPVKYSDRDYPSPVEEYPVTLNPPVRYDLPSPAPFDLPRAYYIPIESPSPAKTESSTVEETYPKPVKPYPVPAAYRGLLKYQNRT